MKVRVLSRGKGGRVEGMTKDRSGFKDGDILVADYLDLAESYRYVPRASAVVLRKGGMLSHLAIIGREYGVPVVQTDEPVPVNKRVIIDIDRGELEVLG